MPLPSVIEPKIPFNPPHYICQRARLPYRGAPDGRLDKPFWEQAKAIDEFHDIEGDGMPRPLKKTSVKLLWDDENLYIGAKLEEDKIWATVTERDEIIYVDNDFEVFLSPKHTTHRYYELEINALNTVWDLLMEKPSRDGVHRIISWDIHGLKNAVYIDGELNNPFAENRFWSIELIIPWFSLRECEHNECRPSHTTPYVGELWRMNFSRVEYQVEVQNGKYVKCINPETGQPYPEYNWVWAPTGVIDIHMPEMWGYLLFADGDTQFSPPVDEQIMWELRKLYYRERKYGADHGYYTNDFELLRGQDQWTINPKIYVTTNLFEVSAQASVGTLHIRQDGYIWRENSQRQSGADDLIVQHC